ncbi:MAG: hypothetical protein M3O36_15160 [Myxococcota bacterium]|nr:hypothetical protein [Myxococcota bacterium]
MHSTTSNALLRRARHHAFVADRCTAHAIVPGVIARERLRRLSSLASFGRTVLAAVGVDGGVMASQIPSGKAIPPALA